MRVRIALVHAVKVAIAPVEEAFRRHWPEAELSNLLDDSLSRDRNRQGALTPDLSRRIGMLATFAPTVPALEGELRALDPQVSIRSICIPEAMAALEAGDGAKHDRLLARAAPQLDGCD